MAASFEMAAGNFGNAIRLIDLFLANNPGNDWAETQGKTAVAELQKLARSIQPSSQQEK